MEGIAINTDTRAGRMLQGLLDSENKRGAVVVTTSLLDADGNRKYHQAFKIRKWTGRDGETRVEVQVKDSGDWSLGIKPTVVLTTYATSGKQFANTRDAAAADKLLQYAARAAWTFVTTGEAPTPANGSVEVVEESRCGVCGRELTHPDSIALGIGPECEGKTRVGATIVGSRAARAKKEAATPAASTEAPSMTDSLNEKVLLVRGGSELVEPKYDRQGVLLSRGGWKARKAAADDLIAEHTGRRPLSTAGASQNLTRPGCDIFGAPLKRETV